MPSDTAAAGAGPRGIASWLAWYLFLLPLGIPIFTYLVPSDFCLIAGIVSMLVARKTTGAGKSAAALPSLRPGHFDIPTALFLAWIGFSLLGILIPDHPANFAFDLGSILWLFAGALCIRYGLETPDAVRQGVRELNGLYLPLLMFCAIGLATHWAGLDDVTANAFSFRLYLPFRFSILLGAYLVTAYPFAVIWTDLPFKRRILHEILYLVVISGVGARSCMLVAIGQVVWTEWSSKRDDPAVFPGWLRFGFFLTAAASAGLLLSGEITLQRSFGTGGVIAFAKDEPRERQHGLAFDHLGDWATGIGLGCFQGRYREELHNTTVNLLVETGIGGLLAAHAALLAIFLPLIGAMRRKEGEERAAVNALLCAALSLYTLGLFHNLLRNRYAWLVLALAVAMKTALAARKTPQGLIPSAPPLVMGEMSGG